MQVYILPESKTRIDKWLWTVRIFKSRTIATDACKAGKIKINGAEIKPSASVSRLDKIEVRKNGFNFQFEVKELLKNRVPAPIAKECFQNNTPASELEKYNDWFNGKKSSVLRARGTGRPTKKDRRSMDDFSDFDEFDEEEF
ncbi:MAG: RNA-binding S4 domain-containing protein [Saprospiraceae bacterium]|jgi:ribosome-associated heat shock protein Hsp15|nr:RNA-binding S4 domain-containing protein [Saprospiraceae bacterium]MCF8299670.1 RNA-binding S4 domain-containing protein [Haliscomenobacter sp.]MCF8317961.1 RNA-binding S4 domain-containing protein [Haliscomenobacter sp.]